MNGILFSFVLLWKWVLPENSTEFIWHFVRPVYSYDLICCIFIMNVSCNGMFIIVRKLLYFICLVYLLKVSILCTALIRLQLPQKNRVLVLLYAKY